MAQQTHGPQRFAPMDLPDELRHQNILIPDLQYQGILSYLQRHSQLEGILPSACANARQVFGSKGELILSVYRDPETEDCHLTLTVRLPSYDKNITQCLDRVTEP